MKSRDALLVVFSLIGLTGMRDPFRQPEDRCHCAELPQWQYQGMVSQGKRSIGLVQDAQHRWRRIENDEVLDNGWTIIQLSDRTLTVSTGAKCEPSQWQWQRQGEVNEAMDTGGGDRHHAPGSGRKTPERDAGGGRGSGLAGSAGAG
ncbi:HofP DNA utilization family protein [Citrobacter amalonaticus]|uniref:HofP DNA utilization family protein n=1 Tax=Citrobacter amalonaticus TaxID=35703 RepID=UPI00300CA92F